MSRGSHLVHEWDELTHMPACLQQPVQPDTVSEDDGRSRPVVALRSLIHSTQSVRFSEIDQSVALELLFVPPKRRAPTLIDELRVPEVEPWPLSGLDSEGWAGGKGQIAVTTAATSAESPHTPTRPPRLARRAHDGAASSPRGLFVEPLGEAEVGDLRSPFQSEQDIGRLQVAMDDATLVGCLHGSRKCLNQVSCFAGRNRAAKATSSNVTSL